MPEPMSPTTGKEQILITVDRGLLEAIDRLTENRSAVVEEGLRLWYQRHVETQLQQFYQNQSPQSQNLDEVWADCAQSELEEILEVEGF